MSMLRQSLVLWTATLLAGCAAYVPTDMHRKDELGAKNAVTGVAMAALPQPGVFTADLKRGGGGGGGLVQALITIGIVSDLAAHAKTLDAKDARAIADDAVALFKRQGLQVVPIAEPLNLRDLESFEARDGSLANKDFRPLQKKLNVDRLLVVRVDRLGFNYPIGGAMPIPAGDAMAEVDGAAFVVDLRTNAFLWHRKVQVLRGVGKAWDEPPGYPALTAKFYEALEAARDELLADLSK